MATNPMHQFNVYKIGPEIKINGIDLSFTNASLFMLISAISISIFLLLGTKDIKIIPGKFQLLSEILYNLISKMISDTAGQKAKPYFPFIFSLFMFILFGNLLGMIPYSYTFTSQIIVTITLALIIFIGVTLIALIKHKLKFFTFFFPSGVPIALAPLLIPIEIISYLMRPVSLSVRLFANMLAGHTMMKVFAGLIIMMTSASGVLKAGAVLPLLAVIGLTGLEFLVAALQAYVFSILTCMYLHDALHLH